MKRYKILSEDFELAKRLSSFFKNNTVKALNIKPKGFATGYISNLINHAMVGIKLPESHPSVYELD